MTFIPDSPGAENPGQMDQQLALACYLSAVVAIGNCVGKVCPSVGAMYRDRLLKLPRRLAFAATPQALEQSRAAVETDLIEYATMASTWIEAGTNHASHLLDHLRVTEETLIVMADLQRGFLEDMAEHIEASAEIDDEAQLRASFNRYAAGLRAYSQKATTEKLAVMGDLRRRREDIQAWIAEATVSGLTDPETGLPNRAAAERRIQTEIEKQRPFCAIAVSWTDESATPLRFRKAAISHIVKQLAERLAAMIRPYDIIFRWSEDRLMTIFPAPEADVVVRATQIGGWLGETVYSIDAGAETCAVRTRTAVSIVEHLDEEPADKLIARIDSVAQPEEATREAAILPQLT